ncbi:MAG: hypothetical protein JWM78_3458 [Verrucomicrobiaceae bacterium]|nr:hypothetical protein [Verrucomicrobiaceae bacterium]
MKNRADKLIFAGIISPLVGPITLLLIVFSAGLISGHQQYQWNYKNFKDLISFFVLFMVMGVPSGYLLEIVLGVPAYIFMRKLGSINIWTVSLGAAFIPTFILSTWFEFNQPTVENNSLNLYIAMLVSGYMVGMTFWFTSGLSRVHKAHIPFPADSKD